MEFENRLSAHYVQKWRASRGEFPKENATERLGRKPRFDQFYGPHF